MASSFSLTVCLTGLLSLYIYLWWTCYWENSMLLGNHSKSFLLLALICIFILWGFSNENSCHLQTSTAVKQLKDLRSLCLKICSLVLNKYDSHEFGCNFWDIFFTSVKPLINSFKQEGSSSEKPSSLFSCFLAMSRSHHLVPLLCREKNLAPDIFSILTVTTSSEAITFSVLKFIENLLILDNELDDENNAVQGILIPNLDELINCLYCLFQSDNAAKRY